MASGQVLLSEGHGLSRTLLIDADIIAYQVSAANETRTDWGDGVVSVETDFEGAKDAARAAVSSLLEALASSSASILASQHQVRPMT